MAAQRRRRALAAHPPARERARQADAPGLPTVPYSLLSLAPLVVVPVSIRALFLRHFVSAALGPCAG